MLAATALRARIDEDVEMIALKNDQQHLIRPARSTYRSRAGIVAVLALLALAICPGEQAIAAVSQCFGPAGTGLCSTVGTACIVHDPILISNGAVLDCGTSDLTIANQNGKLTVDGTMTIRAHNLTVENNRSIEATSGGLVVELSGSLSLWGQLVARNTGNGSKIRVYTALDLVLQTRDGVGVDMVGIGQSIDGGELVLRAGRDLRIGSKILANGNDGTGSDNRNSGGDVDLIAGGSVYVEHLVRAYGRWFHGGHLVIQAGSNVEINNDGASSNRRGEIDLEGKGIDGDGGILDIRAGGSVLQSGPVSVAGGVGNIGGNARGGEIRITAGCGGVRLEDSLNAWGGMLGGGKLLVNSRGNIALAGAISTDAQKLGGDGGDIVLRSTMGNVVVEGPTQIHSNGHVTSNTSEGVGGTVSLYGCQVDIAGGALIEATGQSKGRIEVSAYKQGNALQNSFGIRVSENADLSSYSTGGQIVLRTPTMLNGYCSNSPSSGCKYDADCDAIECTSGNCMGGNPQTDGQVVQFSTVPIVEQDVALGSCAASCQ